MNASFPTKDPRSKKPASPKLEVILRQAYRLHHWNRYTRAALRASAVQP